MSSLTVLIAAPDSVAVLKAQSDLEHAQIFTDAEALRALDVILKQRPSVVALEHGFATSSRGAALINRIKADPSLGGCAIKVVSKDDPAARTSIRDAEPARAVVAPTPSVPATAVASEEVTEESPSVSVVPAAPPIEPVVPEPALPLDQRGTRRAPRYRIADGMDVMIDGNPARLVDLSLVGAMVISATILRPNQRVRVALPDSARPLRFSGAVAWAAFEMPKEGTRYRAGIEFLEPDTAALGRFIETHKVD